MSGNATRRREDPAITPGTRRGVVCAAAVVFGTLAVELFVAGLNPELALALVPCALLAVLLALGYYPGEARLLAARERSARHARAPRAIGRRPADHEHSAHRSWAAPRHRRGPPRTALAARA